MEGTHVYLWPIHIDVWQKSSQYYKVIILQVNKQIHLKFLNNKKKNCGSGGPDCGCNVSFKRMEKFLTAGRQADIYTCDDIR